MNRPDWPDSWYVHTWTLHPLAKIVADIGSHLPCTSRLHPIAPALLYLPPLPTDFTSVTSTNNSQRSLSSSISRFSSSQMRTTRVSLLRVFFFFKRTSVALLVGGGGLLRPWDPVPKKSYHHLGLSPMQFFPPNDPSIFWLSQFTK